VDLAILSSRNSYKFINLPSFGRVYQLRKITPRGDARNERFIIPPRELYCHPFLPPLEEPFRKSPVNLPFSQEAEEFKDFYLSYNWFCHGSILTGHSPVVKEKLKIFQEKERKTQEKNKRWREEKRWT
jgi:hypothetical protein